MLRPAQQSPAHLRTEHTPSVCTIDPYTTCTLYAIILPFRVNDYIDANVFDTIVRDCPIMTSNAIDSDLFSASMYMMCTLYESTHPACIHEYTGANDSDIVFDDHLIMPFNINDYDINSCNNIHTISNYVLVLMGKYATLIDMVISGGDTLNHHLEMGVDIAHLVCGLSPILHFVMLVKFYGLLNVLLHNIVLWLPTRVTVLVLLVPILLVLLVYNLKGFYVMYAKYYGLPPTRD